MDPHDAFEVLVTDVVTRERPSAAVPLRQSRVRCPHCAMPVRGGLVRCWSCGIGLGEHAPPAPPPAAEAAPPELRRPSIRRRRLLTAALLAAVVVTVNVVTVLASAESGQGVRGLAARVRGGTWERSGVSGATVEFPSAPSRVIVPAGGGLPRPAEKLIASGDGVRTELLAAEIADAGTLLDGPAVAEQMVARYAAEHGGRVVERTPRYAGGAPGLDATVETREGLVRLRVTVIGPSAYLMAVTGPSEAFERFAESFRPATAPTAGEAGPAGR